MNNGFVKGITNIFVKKENAFSYNDAAIVCNEINAFNNRINNHY